MDLTNLLANATTDTIIYLRYDAGNPVGELAKKERNQARDWKLKANEFIGHFVSLERNRRKEPVLVLFVHNRGETGAIRRFNPRVGVMHELRILAE